MSPVDFLGMIAFSFQDKPSSYSSLDYRGVQAVIPREGASPL